MVPPNRSHRPFIQDCGECPQSACPALPRGALQGSTLPSSQSPPTQSQPLTSGTVGSQWPMNPLGLVRATILMGPQRGPPSGRGD